jgi:nitrogen-specific signal transduction histidine kinase
MRFFCQFIPFERDGKQHLLFTLEDISVVEALLEEIQSCVVIAQSSNGEVLEANDQARHLLASGGPTLAGTTLLDGLVEESSWSDLETHVREVRMTHEYPLTVTIPRGETSVVPVAAQSVVYNGKPSTLLVFGPPAGEPEGR